MDPISRAPLLESRLEQLKAHRLDDSLKGIPLGRTLALGAIGDQGWNVTKGDLALPTLTLSRAALGSNLATMKLYCARNGVRLAPHGKTTMSPQLFAMQFAHGAWGITAATPTQVAVMRRFGISRILLANELADADALRWIAGELDADDTFEFYCLVDSADTARRMDEVLANAATGVQLSVLLEIGRTGGRAGVRDLDQAMEVAHAVRSAHHLRLAGVEAFEGALVADASDEALAILDELFASVRSVVEEVARQGLFDGDEVIVTAGGSLYFDRVVAALADWPGAPTNVVLVLRSGCYISHDGGKYERLSPLAQRQTVGEELQLVNALTLWASVLSRPEPELVVVGAGIRDAPVDQELPRPRELFRRAVPPVDLREQAHVFRVMDQHLFLRVPPTLDIRAGDIISFDLSHPCTAFDKFRLVMITDDDATVVDAILTFF